MPNRWVEHIRKFAKDNNMTYSCALSDPKIRDGYIPAPKKGKKGTKAVDFEKLEQAFPSTEPKPKNVVIQARPVPAPAKAQLDEERGYILDEGTNSDFNRYWIIASPTQLGNQVVKETFFRIITDYKDNFKSKVAKTKLYNLIQKANTGEMAGLIKKYFNPNSPKRIDYFAQQRFLKDFFTKSTTKGDAIAWGGARGSRVPTSEIQRMRLINQLRQQRQREFDRGNYNADRPPLSTINADLDFLGEKNEPQPTNPVPPTRRALGGARRKRTRQQAAGGDDEEEELEPLPTSNPSTPPHNPPPALVVPDTPIHPSFNPAPVPNPVIMPPPPLPQELFPLTLPAAAFVAPLLPPAQQEQGEGETDNESVGTADTWGSGGGRRLPMEDNFFYPARDRDRRYDMVDYSRVVPHRGGFRMTTSF